MKNSNDTSWDRISDFPICSTAHTVPPRSPYSLRTQHEPAGIGNDVIRLWIVKWTAKYASNLDGFPASGGSWGYTVYCSQRRSSNQWFITNTVIHSQVDNALPSFNLEAAGWSDRLHAQRTEALTEYRKLRHWRQLLWWNKMDVRLLNCNILVTD